jgi:hypothetical protein
VIEIDANINDPVFADLATQVFLELRGQSGLEAPHATGSKALK